MLEVEYLGNEGTKKRGFVETRSKKIKRDRQMIGKYKVTPLMM